MIRVTIYNEFIHEQESERIRAVYPQGIHETLRKGLQDEELSIRTVTLGELPDGLSDAVLDETDVLIWWGHKAHHLVPDEVAQRVQQAVLKGMGIIFLHSGHHSKPFKMLMGTSGNLSWREDGDMERIWTVSPGHPIAQGIGRYFELPHEETYAEPFSIPQPDDIVFMGWYEGGEVFRSGCTFHRENGKIFYFQPGHESFPTYYDSNVQTIIRNAVKWAAPVKRVDELVCPHIKKIGTE